MNKIERQIERLETKAELHGLRGEDAELFHHELEVAQSLRLADNLAKAVDDAAGEDEHGRYLKFTGVDALVEALAAWKEHSDG